MEVIAASFVTKREEPTERPPGGPDFQGPTIVQYSAMKLHCAKAVLHYYPWNEKEKRRDIESVAG